MAVETRNGAVSLEGSIEDSGANILIGYINTVENKVALQGEFNKLTELRGYSAYDIAVLNGFEGSEEEWLKSLKGEKGDPGSGGGGSVATVNGIAPDENGNIELPEGTQGPPGKDGISVTHQWNGTTLFVTSASGTTFADLKGDKGDKGDTGAQGVQGVQGIQGIQGDKGDKGDTGIAGKTPVKGTDYYTDADKAEMVNMVLTALPTWQGGSY